MALEHYSQLLKALLPRGDCWTIESGSQLDRIILGLCHSMESVDQRLEKLKDSFLPPYDMGIWEDFLRVLPKDETSSNYLEAAIKSLGYRSIRLSDQLCSRSGISCAGSRTYEDKWAYCFKVEVSDINLQHSRAGSSHTGDRLATWQDQELEQLVNQVRLAHTRAIFSYGGEKSE